MIEEENWRSCQLARAPAHVERKLPRIFLVEGERVLCRAPPAGWGRRIIRRNRSKRRGRTWKDFSSSFTTIQGQPAIRFVQDSVSVVGYPTGHCHELRLWNCGITSTICSRRVLCELFPMSESSTGQLIGWQTKACEFSICLILYDTFPISIPFHVCICIRY